MSEQTVNTQQQPRVVRPERDSEADDRSATDAVIAGTVLLGPVVVGVCRLIQTFTVASPNLAVGLVGAGLTGLIALICLVMQVRVFWRARDAVDLSRAYVRVLFISLLAIFVSVEAFAGATTVLWQHHLLTTNVAQSSLWRAEKLYLWHLTNSIPVLGIPRAAGWNDPNLFNSRLFGVLILSFKILLIAPLIRIGLTTYQLSQSRRSTEDRNWNDRSRRGVVKRASLTPHPWRTLFRVLIVVIVAYVVINLVFDSGRYVDRWMVDHVAHGGLAWLRTAPQWTVAVLGPLVGGLYLLSFGEFMRPAEATRWNLVVASVLSYLGVIGLILATGIAWTLVLLRTGAVSTSGPIPTGGDVSVVVSAYAWHIADALPGPNIPQTLRWTIDNDLTGRTATIIFLLVKIAVFAVLLFKAGRVIRFIFNRARTQEAALAAIGRCAVAMERIRKSADQIEWRALRSATGLEPQDKPDQAAWSLQGAYERTLLIEVDKVAFVFGDGEVREHVDAAATAVRRRLEALSAADGIQRAGHPIDTLFVDRELDEDLPKNRRAQTRGLLRLSAMKQVKAVELLPRLRDTETQRINDFRTAAVRALRLAADEVDRLRADVDGERGESPALTPV